MNIQSVLLIAAALVVLGIVVVTIVIARSSDVSVTKRVRAGLAAKIKELPFYTMLRKRDVDVSTYLEEAPTSDIERHMDACDTCEHKRQCDETLSAPESGEPDYSFCPNDPEIKELEKNSSAK